MNAQVEISFDDGPADEGMVRAMEAPDAAVIAAVITRFSLSGAVFTSDDVWAALPPLVEARASRRPNQMGACFRAALARGEMGREGPTVRSTRKDRRNGRIQPYRGNATA